MTPSDSRDQILAARERISRAIVERDAAAIAEHLLPTYHVVTARSSHRSGRDASVKSWADLFAHDPAATYSRMPQEILVNDGWGMAQEHGRWTSTISARQGPLAITGVYAAKWHFADGQWLLEAEIFTPLTIEPLAAGDSA